MVMLIIEILFLIRSGAWVYLRSSSVPWPCGITTKQATSRTLGNTAKVHSLLVLTRCDIIVCIVYREHLNADGSPSDKWSVSSPLLFYSRLLPSCLWVCRWEWAKEGWQNSAAVRFPMGRGAKPEYRHVAWGECFGNPSLIWLFVRQLLEWKTIGICAGKKGNLRSFVCIRYATRWIFGVLLMLLMVVMNSATDLEFVSGCKDYCVSETQVFISHGMHMFVISSL